MVINQEKEIRDRLNKRDLQLTPDLTEHEQDKTKIKEEMQQDHQKVLLYESQSGSAEKENWYLLRREIEQQQQKMSDIEALSYEIKTKALLPRPTLVKNCLLAFLVGGFICAFGQAIARLYGSFGLPAREAGSATSATLIFLGAFLTGLGIYDEIGRVAGAGSIVPITGFANSIASSALEFKREGYVYGVGARLFTIAGPVIVYGVAVSIVVGLIYYFIR